MTFFDRHILNAILILPLAGAAALCAIPRERAEWHRRTAQIVSGLGVLAALALFGCFRTGFAAPQFQFTSDHGWIPSIGARFTLGTDGLSVLMTLLASVVTAAAIFFPWPAAQEREREYYALLLLLEASALGVFLSLDFVLFYVFWVLTLVPLYFLIGAWGGERRAYVATKFFIYALASSAFLLLAIVAINAHRGTFDMRQILAYPFSSEESGLQRWLFWSLFFAFAARIAMVPFHTWLPDAHSEAPPAASAILSGAFLQMGTYGFLRFCLPILPDAVNHYRPFLVALSLAGTVYGALVCLGQKDFKRLLAYFSVSQIGLCALGIFTLTPLGISGSVIEQINFGISMAALFLLAGALCERRRTLKIAELGGLAASMPKFAAAYLIFTLSALGMPLFGGFVGELGILRGAWEVRWQWAAWAVFGIVLSAAALLWLCQRVIWGAAPAVGNARLPDLNAREYAMLVPLLLLSLWIGIYPKPFSRILDGAVQQTVERATPGYYAAPAAPGVNGTAPQTPIPGGAK